MENTNRAATLKDIASELGISANTVSKAINSKRGVSDKTVKKVIETAKKLKYVPNSIAKSLRLNSTKTLGVVVSDSSHFVFSGIIKGIEEKASNLGYSIILCNTGQDHDREKDAVELLASKRIDGLILAATMLTTPKDIEYIRTFNIPFVFLMRRSEESDVDYVINDNILGMYIITDHLIKQGYQRIYYLNLSKNRQSEKDRLSGFKKAFKENMIEPDLSIIYNIEPYKRDGYLVMKEILEKRDNVEAVICGCDLIAVGAMEAILENGLRIPEDVKVVGYDDIDLAADLKVPLTTIRQPKYEIGSKGAELLINKIIYKYDDTKHMVLKPELVVRSSG